MLLDSTEWDDSSWIGVAAAVVVIPELGIESQSSRVKLKVLLLLGDNFGAEWNMCSS